MMNRRLWTLVYLPIPLMILLDWFTKSLALRYSHGQEGPFSVFYLIYNHGAMLGLFSDLPPTLRIVTLSTLGALIVGVYLLFQYMIPGRHLKLRIGLSILLGGILGNVLDRIRYGAIVDFIKFQIWGITTPIFNVADAVQWIGYALIVYFFIREGHLLWPKENYRKSFWINAPFQRRFSLFLATLSLILTGVFAVFSYTYLRVTLQELTAMNHHIVEKFAQPFVFLIAGLGVAFAFLIYIVGSIFSHRIAGPIYAFERFIREIMKGNPAHFRVRQSDEFKNLEHLAEEVKAKFIPLHPQSQPLSNVEDKIVSSDDPIDK